MAKTHNTVPQGVAGTGNATIFGMNPVAAQFGNQLAALRQREMQAELLRQREAEKMAQTFRDNQLAASDGRLWAGEIGKLEQDHIQKGIDLKLKGIDPYGISPQALEYQKERRRVEGMQGFRKATEARLNALNQLISSNPDKYHPRDIKSVHDFFSQTNLADAYGGNLTLPQLRERLNISEVLKGTQPITRQKEELDPTGKFITDKKYLDFAPTRNLALAKLAQSGSQGAEFVQDLQSGLSLQELDMLSTDVDQNKETIIRDIMGDPGKLRELATATREHPAILPNTPEFDALVEATAREQARIKRKFDEGSRELVSSISGGLDEFEKIAPYRDPDKMTPYQRETLALRRATEARLGADDDGKATGTDVRRQWIQDIRNVNPNALEKLIAAGNANPEYDKDDKFAIKGAGKDGKPAQISAGKGKIILHVPRKIRLNPEGEEVTIAKAHDYTIDLGDPNFETTMNTLIGGITGANVDLGSLGARSSNLKKSPPSTPVKNAPKPVKPKKDPLGLF